MPTLWQDIRFGLRMLAKNPGFTTVAVATLALGIGANTAIFSLVNAVMLQSIPVRNPQELVVLRWSAHAHPKDIGSSSYGDCRGTDWGPKFSGGCSFSYPMFQQVRAQSNMFSGVATFAGPAQLDLSGNGAATIIRGELVSGDYFQTLGVSPAAGRVLQPSDEESGAEAVAVLTNAYWHAAFGGSPNVTGKNIKLNGVPFTIVGVADPGFTRLTPGHTQDIWLPLSQASALRLRWGGGPEKDRAWWLTIVGRLKAGVSREQAESAVSLLFHNEMIEKKLLKDEDQPQVALMPAQKGLSGVRGQLSEPLFILMTACGLVLLISCANVAGLMLARAASRDKEMAVRLALGASRGQIVRQLLTESVMLSLGGSALGIVMAFWGASGLVAFVASNRYSSFAINADPDVTVLAFTVGIAALTGILFGLAPAFRGTHVNVTPALKANAGNLSGAGVGAGRRFGLGSGLVVAQVALSVIVLAGAGLIVRTLANLKNIDPGFNTQNVLQFGIDPTLAGIYKDNQVEPLYRELSRRLGALPGVASVSYSSDTLLDGSLWTSDMRIEGRADKSTVEVQMLAVGPDFLETMKIPLLAGRTLNIADAESTQPVALVNREFVRRWVENKQALGLHFGGADAKDPQYQIVGIVGDTKYAGLRDEIAPTAYIPVKEGGVHFALRTAMDSASLVPAVRKVVGDLDNNLPLFDVKTQTERIERLLFTERLLARLASLFGLLALLLACIGIYGLLAYEVARRTREIGIRAALGAQRLDMLKLVGGQGLALVVTGAIVGIAGAIALTRPLQTLLFGVHTTDPLTFLVVCALLVGVSILACYIPARRATKVDPMVALRYE